MRLNEQYVCFKNCLKKFSTARKESLDKAFKNK